jgi:hypothetical protein
VADVCQVPGNFKRIPLSAWRVMFGTESSAATAATAITTIAATAAAASRPHGTDGNERSDTDEEVCAFEDSDDDNDDNEAKSGGGGRKSAPNKSKTTKKEKHASKTAHHKDTEDDEHTGLAKNRNGSSNRSASSASSTSSTSSTSTASHRNNFFHREYLESQVPSEREQFECAECGRAFDDGARAKQRQVSEKLAGSLTHSPLAHSYSLTAHSVTCSPTRSRRAGHGVRADGVVADGPHGGQKDRRGQSCELLGQCQVAQGRPALLEGGGGIPQWCSWCPCFRTVRPTVNAYLSLVVTSSRRIDSFP